MKLLTIRRLAAMILLILWLFAQFSIGTAAYGGALYGDADNDGATTTTDARLVMCHVLGAAALSNPAQADLTGDDMVTSADVRAILICVLTHRAPPAYQEELLASQYSGEPYRAIYGNRPLFTAAEKASLESFEQYAPLDSLGRCGVAFANLSVSLMPDEERDSISSVTPTGWHNHSYDFVSGGWVYNRSHLIGFQLAGEQANALNLITGTRYLNMEGMLPFENMVADYIRETGYHVLYRVTPVFAGDNLLAEGVTIEAWSVEDSGDGICFHVFCYNVQPGVAFDYSTGENHAATTSPDEPTVTVTFILNTKSLKFHLVDCRHVASISTENRSDYTGTREVLLAEGYLPCGTCQP